MGILDGLEISLKQAGLMAETYRATELVNFTTAMHFHDVLQIMVMTAGERLIETRSGSIRLQRGDCLLIPAGEPHSGGGVEGRAASFKTLYVQPERPGATPFPGGALLRTSDTGTARLVEAAADALADSGEPAFALPAEDLFQAADMVATCRPVKMSNVASLLSIRDELMSCVEVRPLLEPLARAYGMSKCHLVHTFSHVFGLSPYAYNIRHRINLGKVRLAAGIRPAEVALDLGFYDQSHFGFHFRAVTGLPPASYQKKVLRRAG